MLGAERRGAEALCWTIKPTTAAAGQDEEGEPKTLPVIATDADLDKFLWDYFGIKLPNVVCCPAHSTPWLAFHDAYFARSAVSIWKASRGFGGKTFTLGLLALVEGLTLRADVNVLGGSGIQSKRVLEHIGALWEVPTAPKWALVGLPGQQVQKTIWGNKIQALMASTKSVRGPHPQRLRIDEADETKIRLIEDALGQPMSKGWIQTQVVLSSTHQYADGPMTWALKQAADKGWPVFEWCLHETAEPHGWLSQGEIDRKRSIMTKGHWDTEVLMQEPSSEGRAFDTEKVEQAFRTDIHLEDPDLAAVSAHAYGTGGDWAKKKNWTYITAIRKFLRPLRIVFVKRAQKEPWPQMVSYFDDTVKAYPGPAVHDNTGLGQVVHDLLHVDAEPFNMVGRGRADLLSEYIAAVENGDVVWPRDDSNPALAMAYSEHKYASRDDIFKGTKDGTGKHHLPDSISSAAFAYRATKQTQAQSAAVQPQPGNTPHLQAGVQRGRLSGYMMGRQSRTDDDEDA